MKNIFIRLIFIIVSIIAVANVTVAQDAKQIRKNEKAALIKSLIDSQSFVFVAQYVIPFRGSMRNLTSVYEVKVLKDSIVSDLPYFGRAYFVTDPTNIGFRFTSIKNKYTVTPIKKGGWEIYIKPEGQAALPQFYFRIFENGSASLRVASNDRDPISYQGFIREQASK